uniref:Uncharacterized protein n=1 Tax=Anopheles minimus TaxID=112268 RepID=A0A182WMZ2_9DIPT
MMCSFSWVECVNALSDSNTQIMVMRRPETSRSVKRASEK